MQSPLALDSAITSDGRQLLLSVEFQASSPPPPWAAMLYSNPDESLKGYVQCMATRIFFIKKNSGRKKFFLQKWWESCFDDFWRKKVLDSNFFRLFFSPTVWIIHSDVTKIIDPIKLKIYIFHTFTDRCQILSEQEKQGNPIISGKKN